MGSHRMSNGWDDAPASRGALQCSFVIGQVGKEVRITLSNAGTVSITDRGVVCSRTMLLGVFFSVLGDLLNVVGAPAGTV